MKKIIIVLVLTCLLGLTGCDPGTYHIDEEEILSNTTKIELVQYENANPKNVHVSRWNKPIFDFSKVTFIATLDESYFEDILKDIAKRDFLVFGRTLNEPIGKTLILYQSDGNMVVLFSCVQTDKKGITRYYGECIVFDEDGQFIEYLGDIGSNYVDELESKYFESNT